MVRRGDAHLVEAHGVVVRYRPSRAMANLPGFELTAPVSGVTHPWQGRASEG